MCVCYYYIGGWGLRDDNLAGNVGLLALWLRLTQQGSSHFDKAICVLGFDA